MSVEDRRREAQAWAEQTLARYAANALTRRERDNLGHMVHRLAAKRIAKDRCVLCGFPSIGQLCIGHSDLAEDLDAIKQRDVA